MRSASSRLNVADVAGGGPPVLGWFWLIAADCAAAVACSVAGLRQSLCRRTGPVPLEAAGDGPPPMLPVTTATRRCRYARYSSRHFGSRAISGAICRCLAEIFSSSCVSRLSATARSSSA
uniref:Putative secreted peptide n=1 Tax=Anopheles braziliensis TaxID=58242 RepID=A0A2M3ZP62_9DIPT